MEQPNAPTEKRGGKRLAYILIGAAGVLALALAIILPKRALVPEVDHVEVELTPTPIPVDVTDDPALATPEVTPIPTPTPSPTPEPTPTPTPTRHPLNGDALLVGDEEAIVLDIQIRLMELDYLDFEQPDDEYSDGTADAIRAFQVRNDMHANGICDKETYEALFSDDALTYAMVRGSTGDDVEIVKEQLIELGYLDGTPFGEYDEATEKAVRLFRQKNNLPDDIIVDNEAFEVLLGEDTVAFSYGIGDKSDEIKTYQEQLFEKGYLTYLPDGIYGKQTQNAVRRFQEENGLVVDGCLGKSTIELLKSGKGETFTFTVGTEGADVQRIQERLAHYGYLKSSQVTGYYGDKTKAAVKTFQSRNKLESDGDVGTETMEVLLSNDAKKAENYATPKPTSKTTPKPSGKTTPKPSGKTTPKPSSSSGDSGDTGGGTSGHTITYGKGVETFIQIAESKLGCKYVRGAKGPSKFDCSGFVYWCLNQAGVKQSYMTSIAWRSCTKYMRIKNMRDIKRGDVLIFKGKSMKTGHVGIYLGNGKMIDASSSKGKVRITDTILSSNYWKEHFLMAYRIWG
ncbi:MAG: peptidoglycan-binding protein [Clostridia bacterium]|nr:peptidoglycan-binding protein [Clostridia bacterium]